MLGSFERTLFLSAKRLRELDIGSAELQIPDVIEEKTRSFNRAELLAAPAHRQNGASTETTGGHLLEDAHEAPRGIAAP